MERIELIGLHSYNFYESIGKEVKDYKYGTTAVSEYIPLYVFYSINTIRRLEREQILHRNFIEDLGSMGILYKDNFPKFDLRRFHRISSYSDFFKYLVSDITVNFQVVKPTEEEEGKYVMVGKGMVLDEEGEILMLFSSERSKWDEGENFLDFLDGTINREELIRFRPTLFISTELETNPIYKNINKRIKSDLILKLYEEEIPVVILPRKDIISKNFGVQARDEKSSLTEVLDYLEEEVPNILLRGVLLEKQRLGYIGHG